jgi:hypothetical protein
MTETIRCDQCQAAMINGVFCHETGCPNSRKTFVDGDWVHYVECFYCGCDVVQGEMCDCVTFTDEDQCPECNNPTDECTCDEDSDS